MNHEPFICRFCLKDEGMSVNLFDNNILLNINLQSWINRTFGLKIDKDDGLPENACISCILVVFQTYFFQKICQESENILTQHVEVQEDAGCLFSSTNNGKKSNFARGSSSESTVQGSSSSATHILKQNEVSSWACENSVDPISTNSASDLLIPLGVEQKNSPNNKALPENCLKSYQQKHQELEVKFISEISRDSNLHNGRNKSGTARNYGAEPEQFHTCVSQGSTWHAKSFQDFRDPKLVQSFQNSPSSSEQLPSEIEECASNCNLGFHKDYQKQGEPSPVSVEEPIKERRDKKSEFYMEFVKFLNTNVCQSNVLTGMNEEIQKLNLKRERIISQGIKPKELFNSIQNQGKERAMVKVKSHLLKKCKNPSSMTLGNVESNIQLNSDGKKPTTFPGSGRDMAHSSKDAFKSVPENLAHACSTLEETQHPSILEENYSKSVGNLNECDVSLKQMDSVPFKQSPITLNDGIANTHTEQCPATSEEKISFFKGNTMSGTISLLTPIKKNGNPCIESGDKSIIGEENNENGHSCAKIAKIMIDQDLCNGLPSVVGKDSKKNMTKQSLSSIKCYNLEPECSQAVLSSPCRLRFNVVKELATKPDTFSRPLNRKLFSPHRGSFSHSDQTLQCVLTASQSIKSREQENEQSTNEKNDNYLMDDSTKCSRIIGSSGSSLQLQGMRHTIRENVDQPTSRASMHEKPITVNPASGVCEGHSTLMEGEIHGKKGDNVVSMGHKASDDLQYLKHLCGVEKSDVKASTKEAMKVKMGISSVIEGVSTEKSKISSSSQVAYIQLKSPTEHVSSFGKQNSMDTSIQNTGEKLLNHDSSSPTRTYHESLTQLDSFMQIPSVSAVQSLNAMADDSLSSKHAECMGDKKNSSECTSALQNKKLPQNNNSLSKKMKRKRKRNSRAKKAKMSMNNFNRISFTFPCPVCFEVFSKHELVLKHLFTHNKHDTLVKSSVNFAQLKIGISKPLGNLSEVNKSPISQQQVSKLKTYNAVGPVRDEKIDEIRGIIQQHLTVNGGSLNGGGKSFRCPACFKIIPDWYEVTMHIILDHDNLSSEWPMSFLFSPEIFRKLVGNESNFEGSTMPVLQPGITTLQPLNVCKHCCQQFYSKSALLKHLIWAHDKSLIGLNE
ncbi:uncharacterized protein [Hetaerina americana]|uniref:uncharacterized protein n=1 Tax=Hetaerina americana TaxID=62018 RepID=UPI003A7F5D5D